eukprot:8444120-Alexandrium_andersonii.AAC.1
MLHGATSHAPGIPHGMVGWAVADDLKAHLHPWVKLSIGFGPARPALKHKPQNCHRSAAGTWKLNRTCPTNLNLSGSKRCPFGLSLIHI